MFQKRSWLGESGNFRDHSREWLVGRKMWTTFAADRGSKRTPLGFCFVGSIKDYRVGIGRFAVGAIERIVNFKVGHWKLEAPDWIAVAEGTRLFSQ